MQRVWLAEQERLLGLGPHLIPGRRRRIEAVAAAQRLHDVVAAVVGLAQVALGEEAGRMHRTATERLVRVDDQLVRIGNLQGADAVAGEAGRGVVRGGKVAGRRQRRGGSARRAAPGARGLVGYSALHPSAARVAGALSGEGEQDGQVVVYLRRRADRRAATIRAAVGPHRDRDAEPTHGADRRLGALARRLALVHREGLEVAAPGLGLEHVAHEARFARTRHARDDGERPLGEVDIDALQVVRAGAADLDRWRPTSLGAAVKRLGVDLVLLQQSLCGQ